MAAFGNWADVVGYRIKSNLIDRNGTKWTKWNNCGFCRPTRLALSPTNLMIGDGTSRDRCDVTSRQSPTVASQEGGGALPSPLPPVNSWFIMQMRYDTASSSSIFWVRFICILSTADYANSGWWLCSRGTTWCLHLVAFSEKSATMLPIWIFIIRKINKQTKSDRNTIKQNV